MTEGVDGLLRDKTRPPGVAPVPADRVAEIVRLTQAPPLDLSRLRSGLSPHLCGLSLECQGAFAAKR
jgi:hypothetical protein